MSFRNSRLLLSKLFAVYWPLLLVSFVWWPIVANLNLNLYCNHTYTTTFHWVIKSIFNIKSTTRILLIWFWIVLWIELVIRLMIYNKQIKNGNIKLCGSNRPSWPVTAIVFCRTRIRLRNLSIVFLSIMRLFLSISMRCSLIKIQDTKFKWRVLRNLPINGNFEHFKNVF